METSSLERYIIISHYRYLVYNKCKNANSFRNSLFDRYLYSKYLLNLCIMYLLYKIPKYIYVLLDIYQNWKYNSVSSVCNVRISSR